MTTSFTVSSLASALTSLIAATARNVAGVLVMAVKVAGALPVVVRAHLNRGPILQLLEMDDRMLRDIGITRYDVTSALSGGLMNDPSTRLRIYAVERRAGLRAQARERLAAGEHLKVDGASVPPRRIEVE